MSARRLLLLGPPGAGKGTQARLLAAQLGVPVIATGDMLRQAVAEDSQLGRSARALMEAGKLVTDELVIEVAKERLNREDARHGFILDGFPRTVAQARALDALLQKLGVELECCVMMVVDEDEVVERLLKRARIEGRSDDNEVSIRVRMREYREKTAPLAEHYRKLGVLRETSGSGSIEQITTRIEEALKQGAEELA